MKKNFVLITVATMMAITSAIHPAPVQAATDIKVTVNEATVKFPDQKPIVNDNRVLIPTRFVAQSLGGKVGFNNATKTVTIQQGDQTIILKVNSNKVTANGKKVTLDVPAKVVRGRIMVPLRFVSEAMAASVDWQQARSLVVITTGSTTTPVPETPTTKEGNFKFDQNFTTMAKKLFVNNLVEANGKVTFTIPEGVTAYHRDAKGKRTDLNEEKQYSYDVGQGKGFIFFTYVDLSKVVPGAQKQAEQYTISLDGTRWEFNNPDKAVVAVDDSKLKTTYGTVDTVVKLAKNL